MINFDIAEDLAFLTVYSTDKLYKATIPASGGTFAFTKVLDTGSQPRQVDYDPVEKKIYWIEWGADMIGRCDLNGNNAQHHSVATSKYDSISYLNTFRLFLSSYFISALRKKRRKGEGKTREMSKKIPRSSKMLIYFFKSCSAYVLI